MEAQVIRDHYDTLRLAVKDDLRPLAASFFAKRLITRDNRDTIVRKYDAMLLINTLDRKVATGDTKAFYTALEILKKCEGTRHIAEQMEQQLKGQKSTSTSGRGTEPMDKLTAENELQVKNAISRVNNWFGLGEQLEMPFHELEAIRINENVHGVTHQRSMMVHKWLSSDINASWSKLCGALDKIGENAVAEEIRTANGIASTESYTNSPGLDEGENITDYQEDEGVEATNHQQEEDEKVTDYQEDEVQNEVTDQRESETDATPQDVSRHSTDGSTSPPPHVTPGELPPPEDNTNGGPGSNDEEESGTEDTKETISPQRFEPDPPQVIQRRPLRQPQDPGLHPEIEPSPDSKTSSIWRQLLLIAGVQLRQIRTFGVRKICLVVILIALIIVLVIGAVRFWPTPNNTESPPSATGSKLSRTGRPTMAQLQNFNDHINIMEEIGTDYNDFGIAILKDKTGSKVKSIEKEYRQNCIDINREILRRWLAGEGLPATWGTLIDVLERIKKHTLAKDIRKAVNSG